LARRLIWAALFVVAGCSREPQVNVLLISVDTLRADHLGCYGYAKPTSPRIDALAKEGVLFENAFSSTSWTLPAHMTMLTGLPISAHGVCEDRHYDRHDEKGERIPPPLRGRIVAEALRANDYRTAGFYCWKYLDDSFGFDAGFDVWQRCGVDLYSHPVLGVELARLRKVGDVEGMKTLALAYPELLAPRNTSPEAVDAAISWLDAGRAKQDERPFFLFVHLFDVHDPYKPPKEFDRFGDPAYAGPIDEAHAHPTAEGVKAGMPAEDLARLVSLYDGGIAFVDSQIGRLLDHLDAAGLAENTLVILTADHGEEFFEHGDVGHRQQLYRESIAVPLILRQKGKLAPNARIAENVGLVDVVPTILAATRTEALHALPGVDLGAIARGESGGANRVYESTLFVFDKPEIAYRQVSVVTGDHHAVLTFCPDEFWRGELYNERKDPHERLAPRDFDSRSDTGREVLSRLVPLVRAYASLRASLPDRGVGLRPLDDLEKKQLSQMGYTGLSDPAVRTVDGSGTCTEGCIWGPASSEKLAEPAR
jgi:arylsulfatase A-like enzyme